MPINVNYSPDLAVMANFAQRAGYGDYSLRQQQMAMQQQQQAVENSLRERQFQDNVARNQSQAWTGWIGQQDAMARARSQAWMQDAQLRDQSALNWAKFGEQSQAQRFNDQMRQAQGYMQYEKAYGDYTNDAGRVANQQQQIADMADYRNQVLQREQAESIQRYGQPSSGDDLYDYANGLGQYSNSLAQQQMQAQAAQNQARIQGREDLQQLKWSREDTQLLEAKEGEIRAVRAAMDKGHYKPGDGERMIEQLESQKSGIVQQGHLNARQKRANGLGPDEPLDAVQHRQKTTSVDPATGNTWAVGANGEPKLVVNKAAEDAKQMAELRKLATDAYSAELKEWQKKKADDDKFTGAKPTVQETVDRILEMNSALDKAMRGPGRQAAAEQKAMTEPIVQDLQSLATNKRAPVVAQESAAILADHFQQYQNIDLMPEAFRDEAIAAAKNLKRFLTPDQQRELDQMVTPGEQLPGARKLTRKQNIEAEKTMNVFSGGSFQSLNQSGESMRAEPLFAEPQQVRQRNAESMGIPVDVYSKVAEMPDIQGKASGTREATIGEFQRMREEERRKGNQYDPQKIADLDLLALITKKFHNFTAIDDPALRKKVIDAKMRLGQ